MCVLPEQIFSQLYPEYDFVYHWEADVRFLGDYGMFFAAAHGEMREFCLTKRRDVLNGINGNGLPTSDFARKEKSSKMLTKYQTWLVRGSSTSERNWESYHPGEALGNEKEADLLTFNPIMDIDGSGWYWTPIKASE
jgi:hypothetical protein